MPVIGMDADPTQTADPTSLRSGRDDKVNILRLRTLAGGGGDGGGGEDVVHAAGAVAFGVEGDVEEAERLDCGGDLFEDGESEGSGEIFAGDFDASEVAVVADADLGEAEGVEGGFGLFDLREILAGDGAAVLDAGGEA